MGLEHDDVLRNEIAEKDRAEVLASLDLDDLGDYLDEQARLRHLEQSWSMTGQEM